MDLAREPRFRLGGMEVRPSTRELVFDGKREVLEPRVMAVLVTLARMRGEVVTREDLTAACWDGRIVSDDAINRVISRIRRAADLTGGRDFSVETVTKVGYRLVAKSGADGAAAVAGVASSTAKPWWRRALVVELVVLITAAAATAFWLMNREPTWAAEDPSAPLTLAVLPFDNLGPTEEDLPLAIGMSREIRNTLSRVRGLRVVSDSSSFAIAAENLSADRMGRRLNADYLLEGSLARTGETVKLSAELVDGWSGVNLWTGSQSGPAADLDRLRQMMSAAVFEQLVARIGPNRVKRLAEPKRSDPRAYRLLLEAQQLLESVASARMRGQVDYGLELGDRADGLIDQALAIEPDSPLGLRLKGQIVRMAATRKLFALNQDAAERAVLAAEFYRRAIAADPDAVPALAALGEFYRRYEWRWADARALFERALALDPNHSEAHLSYAYYLSGAGRCVEALEHAQAAIAIDPEFGWRTLGVPRALKCLGRFEDSDAAYLAALDQDPANVFVLREVYLNKLVRRDAAGLEELRRHVRDELWKGKPSADVQRWLDWTAMAIVALNGDPKPFRDLIERDVAAAQGSEDEPGLKEFSRGQMEVAWIQAIELAIAGSPDRAIELLERSVREGVLYIPETMPYGAYEFTREVRASPRYQAIWKRDPRLVELMDLRRQAVEGGQMDGYLPNGQRSTPKANGIDKRS